MSEIEALKAKLAARKGKPGLTANVAAIEAMIAKLEGGPLTFRDKPTGRFVSTDHALANPDTTLRVED